MDATQLAQQMISAARRFAPDEIERLIEQHDRALVAAAIVTITQFAIHSSTGTPFRPAGR